jgi:TolB-like protein/Flp pilus assembly protein TadD
MKRCPKCNRVEPDDALVFCRTDGTPLVNDSSSVRTGIGTVKFSSAPGASETETSILPQTVTDADMSRATGPTTLLDRQRTIGGTRELSKPKWRRAWVLTVAAIIAIALAASAYFYLSRGKNTASKNSIAVLPFVNAGNDPNTEYLSDGISEALINSLTELQQLRVIARSTAFRYKGKDADPQQVGRELNVQTVLMGRVHQLGDRLSIQVDLVDATTGAQLWGAEYERKLSDVLSVKQTIAREITDKLRLKLSGEDQQRLVRRDTTDAEAYQSYMRGRYYWNKRTADGLKRAIQEFQQATERDPVYALGYVGLADSYLVLDQYAGTPTSDTLPKAKAAVRRALQIDDTLPEAHASMANVYAGEWQWANALMEFKRAISLNPNYPTAHHWLAIYYVTNRQFNDALKEMRWAHDLDPLSPIIGSTLGMAYLLNDDPNSALEPCRKVIEIDPNFPSAHLFLGWAYRKLGRNEEAVTELQKAVELSGRASFYLADLGYIYGVAGERSKAIKILMELEDKYSKQEAAGSHVAGVYAGLNEKDQAFAWLEKDLQQRNSQLPDVAWWFTYDGLRADPRYAHLLSGMGLKQ